MKHRFSYEAREDLRQAVTFYESQREGLGAEFAVEVGVAIAKILEAPNRWPEYTPPIRKYRLDRFPFAIFYRFRRSGPVDIVALLDLRSDPNR